MAGLSGLICRWVCKDGEGLAVQWMALRASGSVGGEHRPPRRVQERERSPEAQHRVGRGTGGQAGGERAAAREGGTRTPGVGALARRSQEEAEESER